MNITFDILNDPKLLLEFVKQVGYQEQISGGNLNNQMISNSVSPKDFAIQFLQDLVANYIKTYEVNQAIEETRTKTISDTNEKITAITSLKEVNIK